MRAGKSCAPVSHSAQTYSMALGKPLSFFGFSLLLSPFSGWNVFYQTQHKARLDHPLDPLYLCRSIYFVPCCSPIGGFLRPEMIIACRKWSHHVLMRSLRSPFSFLNCSSFVLLLSAFDEEKVIKCHHSWIFPPYIEAEHRSSNKFRCLGRLSIKSSTENITFWNQFHIYRA